MTMENLLPVYHRSPTKLPVSFNRLCRSKERLLLTVVCVGLVICCFGTVFFLPELRNGLALPSINQVYNKVYQKVQKASPEFILQLPPLEKDDKHPDMPSFQHHGQIDKPDFHLLEDQARLKLKIENEEHYQQKVLPRPNIPSLKSDSTSSPRTYQDVQVTQESNIVALLNESMHRGAIQLPTIQGGEDSEPSIQTKRDTVRKMMKHAWDNYATYAWGNNELRPITHKGHSASIFGASNFGATIVDSLDTLYIMGLNEEFQRGRDWVHDHLNLTGVNSELSVFETNIRFVGGLLSCYSLTGDVMFRDKAYHIAKKLLPAFNTPTGIPNALVNIANGNSKNYAWASNGASILSEFGTMSLEFNYLSDVTGDGIFREKIRNIVDAIKLRELPNGLYPNYLNPKSGLWGQQHVSMGALGDSFYEYLLKAWLQSGKKDDVARNMYVKAMKAATKKLIQTSSGGLTYFAEMKFGRLEHKMDHLACFTGGMLALGSRELEKKPNETHMELEENPNEAHMELGKAITHTCHESYDRTNTKLGPEAFRFSEAIEAKALKANEKYYILRPEVVESYFVLWRLTHDPRYRQWGWEVVMALEKYCRVDGGYTGLKNVYSDIPATDDVQQSFFLAETLKYLYLLFSDDGLISMDNWVFNTEAHPLPIKGANPFYRNFL